MPKKKKKQFRRRELKLDKYYDQCAADMMKQRGLKFNRLIELLIEQECKKKDDVLDAQTFILGTKGGLKK